MQELASLESQKGWRRGSYGETVLYWECLLQQSFLKTHLNICMPCKTDSKHPKIGSYSFGEKLQLKYKNRSISCQKKTRKKTNNQKVSELIKVCPSAQAPKQACLKSMPLPPPQW